MGGTVPCMPPTKPQPLKQQQDVKGFLWLEGVGRHDSSYLIILAAMRKCVMCVRVCAGWAPSRMA